MAHWSLSAVFLSVIFLASVSAVFFWRRNCEPYLLIGWLWFLGTLLPVIGLVQVGNQAMADRYTYISQIGLWLCVVWGAASFAEKWKQPWLKPVVTASAISVCLCLTCRQIHFWKNSETLFLHAIAVTENNALAYNNLGGALLAEGKVDAAIGDFQKVLEINSHYAEAHHNLGDAFIQKGNRDEAIVQYQKALAINPRDERSHVNLGIVLYQSGRIEEAIAHYQKALDINPADTRAHNNLGLAFVQLNRMDEAISHYENALAVDPQNLEAYFNLGNAFVQTGQFEEAIIIYKKALELNPDDAEVRNNLGLAFYQSGHKTEAIASAQRALQLATAQTNSVLAEIIRNQLKLYQTNP